MDLRVEERDERAQHVDGRRHPTLGEVHRLQRHVGRLHLRQALLDVAVVLRAAGGGIGFHRHGFELGERLGPAWAPGLHLAQQARHVLRHACEDLPTGHTTPVERALAPDLLQCGQHRHRVGPAGDGCSQGVAEQLPCGVDGRRHDQAPQQPRGHAQDLDHGREHRRDARQPLDQQFRRHAKRVGVDHRVPILALDAEPHRALGDVPALALLGLHGVVPREACRRQLPHRVLHREVVHRHVDQHRGVLHAAGEEVEDGLLVAHQLDQMRVVLEVADAHRRLATDDKLRHTAALAVVGDVVVVPQQTRSFVLGDRARLRSERDEVAVVGVVDVTRLVERLLQRGVGLDCGLGRTDLLLGRQAVHVGGQLLDAPGDTRPLVGLQRLGLQLVAQLHQFTLCCGTPEVQLVEAFVLGPDGAHVEREQAVGSVGAARLLGNLLARQDVDDLLDVGAVGLGLNDVLGLAVLAPLLDQHRCAVRDGLRREVHLLALHAQVVHRLRGFERGQQASGHALLKGRLYRC